ncbi:MAG: hypothetical protein KZQ89_21390 [Candidatus Thiodiazotropha sp. (ex Lucinoma kastoroae)]|nr:hypothetical protein [Candidatus Thiodiazotropha sp. (ex Lucinoma kastoroae)]MCU7860456.1 hypothetical protein [Candidatus Thiodiazotropha sp. (ex Lucinoma kastoroae)]
MTIASITSELADALVIYRQAIARTTDQKSKEDYQRLAAITDKIISAMQSGDDAAAKMGLLGFSRQVSDAFSTQPPEFKALAGKIAEIKKLT